MTSCKTSSLKAVGRVCLLFVHAWVFLHVTPALAQDPEVDDEVSEDSSPTGPEYESTTVAPAPRVTATETRVDQQTLSVVPSQTAEEFLRVVPGMLIVQHGNEGKGYQFFVRGFDAVHGSDVEVRMEGIPLNEASNVHANGYLELAFIIPEVVLSLSAVKGTFALWQGNFATAASVDYGLGVDRDHRGTSFGYEVATTNRHRLIAIYAPESAPDRSFVALEGMHDDGLGHNRLTQRLSALGQAVLWRPSEDAFLEGLASAYLSRFGLPGLVRLDDYESGDLSFLDSYLDDTMGLSARGLVSLRYRTELGEGRLDMRGWAAWRRLELEENYTGYIEYAEPGDGYSQREDSIRGGMSINLRWPLSWDFQLLELAGWQLVTGEQTEAQIDEDSLPWRTNRDLNIIQHHAFLASGFRWFVTDWLDVEGGGRLDAFHFGIDDQLTNAQYSDTLFIVSPRLTSTAYAGDDCTVFAGFGRGMRSPTARSITSQEPGRNDVVTDQYTGGEPIITASTNVEIGTRWTLEETFELALAGFAVWIDREVIFDHVSRINLELNGTRRLGMEIDAHVHPLPWLEISGDMSWVDARFPASGNPIPGAPPLLGNLRLAVFHPVGVTASTHLMVLAPRPLAHGAESGTSVVLDAMAGYSWEWLSISAEVENLLGADWLEGEYHFASWWDQDETRSQLPVLHYTAGPSRVFRFMLTGRF